MEQTFSKREHLMVFRKPYKGPIEFSKGEMFWTKVRSCRREDLECFVFLLDEHHPEFSKLAERYSEMYDQDWDGTFIIPCAFVEFADQESEDAQRPSREKVLKMWRRES